MADEVKDIKDRIDNVGIIGSRNAQTIVDKIIAWGNHLSDLIKGGKKKDID